MIPNKTHDEAVTRTIKVQCAQHSTSQKMKFSIKNFFSKFDQIRRPGDLVTFAEEILNGTLNFLGSHFPQPSYP